MSAQIYLIRHGTTAANQENRFAGRLPVPLSPEGREELTVLAQKFSPAYFDHIYCGPLTRTRESAQIIADQCQAQIHVAEELTDINIPHWQGLTKEEIRTRFGDEYPTWLATPDKFNVPGCERLADVQVRALALLKRIQADHDRQKILLVTHLIVGRCLLLAARKQPLARFRSIELKNGEVVKIE